MIAHVLKDRLNLIKTNQ